MASQYYQQWLSKRRETHSPENLIAKKPMTEIKIKSREIILLVS
jgi:hypothetical protein